MNASDKLKHLFLGCWNVIRRRLGLIILVFLFVAIATGAISYFQSRAYLAKVAIEVKPERSYAPDGFGPRGYDPAYLTAQIEILQKAEILDPVVQRLDLTKVFSQDGPELNPQQALAALRSRLTLEAKNGAAMIEIGVLNKDPQLAANIANTIAAVYRESLQKETRDSVEENLKQFKDEVEKQRSRVIDEHQSAIRLLSDLRIVDNDPLNASAPITSDGRQDAATEAEVNEAQKRVDQLRAKVESINKLKPDGLLENLPALGIDDPTVKNILPLLQDIRVEEKRLSLLGLGEDHPKLREARAVEGQYDKMLQEALEGVRRSQTEQLKVAEDTLKTIKDNLQIATAAAADAKQKTHDYVNAKTTYLEDKRILDTMNMQYETERMKEGVAPIPVLIWEKAVPPTGYIWPNAKACLGFALGLGLVISLGLAFLIEFLGSGPKNPIPPAGGLSVSPA